MWIEIKFLCLAVSETQTQRSTQSSNNDENIQVDFTSLEEELKTSLKNEAEVESTLTALQQEVTEAQEALSKLQAPTIDASERLVIMNCFLLLLCFRMEEVKEREQEANEKGDASTKKCRKTREAFDKIKRDRYERFQEYFEPISQRIDEIYKVI